MKRLSILILTVVFTGLLSTAHRAQSLPDIFAGVPKRIVETTTIAEFPVNTFLENVAVDQRGVLYITNLEAGTIERVTGAGAKTEFARITGKIAGLAFGGKGDLIVTGWADGKTPSVFRVDQTGKVETLAAIEGAEFLNGITPLGGDRFLIADSYKGAIWEFDAKNKTYSIWLADEALARANRENPFPAVNGLKIFGGALYATNTERQTILRIPIQPGGKAGKPAVWVEKINGDDFAFDRSGNLYVTTHVYNSVVRVAPDGKMTVIAEGGTVTGGTALAFGRGKKDRRAIYVVTNGGMSLPPAGGVQTAKITRLEIGAK